uniref:Matrix remodeling-associated protein 8 n=1 Tax=Tetraodon nigroviridis TaxID=99883 RepID=H3CP95_TETNG
MRTKSIVLQTLRFILSKSARLFSTGSGQSDRSSMVVAGYNVSAPAGSTLVLQCVSSRMVWTRDRVRDRQRVVHWDLFRDHPDYAMERVLDMFSAGDQRIYNSYNAGRVGLSPTAFRDGNFSLVIKDVTMNDRGLYSCNLHNLYCHLYEMVRIQVNVTKSRRKQQRFWDGQKAVYVVLLGSTVVLPCINRRKVWTDLSDDEDDQVVHWDRQAPGVSHDRADRLVDLYSSGEQRNYGSQFLQKMNISSRAFTDGDFSLTVSDLQERSRHDQGKYSCHLHHHYCGLHERREFQVTVEPPLVQTTVTSEEKGNAHTQTGIPDSTKAESPQVINVILPSRHHFLLPLGYVLTSFLLLVFIILTIVLITHRHKSRGLCCVRSSGRSRCSSEHFEMDSAEVAACSLEDRNIGEEQVQKDYKNNLLKERVHLSPPPKVIDLDKVYLHNTCL